MANKMRSRKLWAWIVTVLLLVGSMVLFKIAEISESEAMILKIGWVIYGIVTGIYISFQAIIDAIEKLVPVIADAYKKVKDE